MKERVVLEKHELYKLLDCLPMQMVTDEDLKKERKIVLFGKEYKIEKVPETWEDLKDLCKGIKEKLNKEIWKIKIEDEFIYVRKKWETKEICFTSVGNMVSNNGWDLLMTNLTPARQWQIIKNLVGEK